ncbi:MAG: response regulator [Gemmatimonadales bacterium]
MTELPIRIVVADDHALVRAGITGVLAATPGFEVVAEAGTGHQAIELVNLHDPQVVVLDISMPGLSGLEAAATLRAEFPLLRILMLSVHDHPEYVMESVRAGANGYLRKDATPQELRDAIRAVARGDEYYSPAVAKQLSAALRGETPAPERQDHQARLEALTRRERDVLLGVTAGMTNKEVAADLGLSPRTIESYRESLMRKLGIYTVAELTKFALEAGAGAGGRE